MQWVKTSIIRRYTKDNFTPNYYQTFGVDFAIKNLQYREENVCLQLWDVAGHEKFGNMTRMYYKYAIAAIIVFDLSRPATFDAVTQWRDDLNSKVTLANGQPIPILLLANKCDLPDIQLDRERLDKFAKEQGFIAWYETSAQNSIHVDEAMNFLVEKIIGHSESMLVPNPNENNGIEER